MSEKRQVWLRHLAVCLILLLVGIAAWVGSLDVAKQASIDSGRSLTLVLALLVLAFACGLQIAISTVILAILSIGSRPPRLVVAHGVAAVLVLVLVVLTPRLIGLR
jgi:hypothetical protein